MNYSLCLSLGHNSSAVLIDNGIILCGYENERITGIKSDSAFPVEAIREIDNYYDLKEVKRVYISHWSTFGRLDEMSFRHWHPDYLHEFCPNAIIQLHVDHHDCHVYALRAFAVEPFKFEIVADGFGNFNETISIYKDQKLIHRAFGFDKSLGLLYQYATAYLGLKMNQDEYKLLGYEAHILKVLNNDQLEILNKSIDRHSKKYFKSIMSSKLEVKFDLVAGLEALPNIRLKIQNTLAYQITKLGLSTHSIDDFDKRVIISYFVQSIVEKVMGLIIANFFIDEVALSGGLFMNVKLNNSIAKLVKKICIMPICGDQSGGIGAYNYHCKDLKWPEHLFWAKRNLDILPLDIPKMAVYSISNINAVIQYIKSALIEDRIVNIVTGNGEFGARALGNTSTLALPARSNVEYINMLNDRSTIMPMAGIINQKLLYIYKDSEKVHKSLEYMIITLDHKSIPFDNIIGCHHKHPIDDTWTNRVQVVNSQNKILSELLDFFGMLINTSFNIHGQPIVLSADQIVKAHKFQCERDSENRVLTIILR